RSLRATRRQERKEYGRERIVEESDLYHAITECYPGALYLSQGTTYHVQDLDLQGRRVQLAPVPDSEFYTEPLIVREVAVRATHGHQAVPDELHRGAHAGQMGEVVWGQVSVVTQVCGYAPVHRQSRAILGTERYPMPLSWTLETQAFWLT